jgi:hypothetical protein
MKCAIMQPTYLPWLGYFELMDQADIFVFLDDVQFAKKSWQQRNRIRSVTGELLIVVPVKASGARFQIINEVLVDNAQNWRRKHLKSIQHSYFKAPFYSRYIGDLEEIFAESHTTLVELNLALIEFLKQALRIRTPTLLSSTIPAREGRNEKVIDICRHVRAQMLYDAQGAREVLDLQRFSDAGIALEFQAYKHPVYSQLHEPFIPYLSTLDLLFNEGDNSLNIIRSGTS